jgi:hypothetical protein
MLLNAPLSQPKNLLIGFTGLTLVGLGQKQKIAPFVSFSLQNNRHTPTTHMEGNYRDPFDFLKYFTRHRWLFLSETKDISACRRPAVLGSKNKPQAFTLDNL